MTFCIVVPCDETKRVETHQAVKQWADSGIPNLGINVWHLGGISPTQKMNDAWRHLPNADVIAFIHSDVEIYEDAWGIRLVQQFEDPAVGVVGFGGAVGLGTDDLYKAAYRVDQLARIGYMSNTIDAEFHGERERGTTEVAVLDEFCMAVRRPLLARIGGWPKQIPFHMYGAYVSLMAHRLGYRTRMVGVECWHRGGGHSVKGDWSKRCVEEFGMTDQQIHSAAHVYIYQNFREELPLHV